MLTGSSITAPFTFLSKLSLWVALFRCTVGPRVHIYFHPDSKHFTMFPALQAARREGPDPEGTGQCSERRRCAAEQEGEEGIVGSLNTVLLCGRIPKCFFVCARAMHHPELQQTTHTRGSTSAQCACFSN